MSDNKKYYYLKVKENFFESEQMIILESLSDGHLYSNILLKLYLRSLKSEGKLMFNERIPYNSNILAQIVRHPVGVVEKAIKVFVEFGLIEVLDNGAIYMLDIQNYIGQSSTEADRQRDYQRRIMEDKGVLSLEKCKKSNMKSNAKPNKKSNRKSTPEIELEIELEKEIELRDRDYIADKPQKNTKFIPPTFEDVKAYCIERDNGIDANRFIDHYTANGWFIGKNKMKDWKAAVRTWEKNNKSFVSQDNKTNKASFYDMMKDEGII